MRFTRLLSFGALIIMIIFTGGGCSEPPSVYNELVGKTYVTLVDTFLYCDGPDNRCIIEPPGASSDVPPTVECYLRDPDRWMYSQEALCRGVSVTERQVKVLAVIPAGTYLTVNRMRKASFKVGELYYPIGAVKCSPFENIEIDLFPLFRGMGGGEPNPRPNPEYLREVK